MKLAEIIDENRCRTDLASDSKMDVLRELSVLLADGNDDGEAAAIARTLVDRERLATTGVGGGIAIPHGKLENRKGISAAVGVSRTGVPFDAVDDQPVSIFFALVAPLNSSGEHLRSLARISRLLKSAEVRERILDAEGPRELYEVICEEDGKD